jgi:hypothetical protein
MNFSFEGFVLFVAFNATFNNISDIAWQCFIGGGNQVYGLYL